MSPSVYSIAHGNNPIYTSPSTHSIRGEPAAVLTRVISSTGTRGLRPPPGLVSFPALAMREVSNKENAETALTQGFDLLKQKQWVLAVNQFQNIRPETQKQEVLKATGLACALYPQSTYMAKKALDLLDHQAVSGNRDITLLLTRSRILQSLNLYGEAETLLRRRFREEAGDPDGGKPCRNPGLNLELILLWELSGNFYQADSLLIPIFKQESGDLEKGQPCKQHEINLILAFHWQMTGRPSDAENLLMATFSQEGGNLTKGQPCTNHETNLTLAKHWQITGKPGPAENLLIATFCQEGGDMASGQPCRNHETNLILAHHWQTTGKPNHAEDLLIATFRQEGGNLQRSQACWNPETNRMLARHWQKTGKIDKAARLSIATTMTRPGTGSEIIPVRKTIHFIRHAQGYHNAAARDDPNWFLREDLLDPHLTDTGKRQCEKLSRWAQLHLKNVQLVVVSPMNRTIQTATYSIPHLMNNTQWIALESIREQACIYPCGKRSAISQHRANYQHINFDSVTFDEDLLHSLYPAHEPKEHVVRRGIELIKWLSFRPEEEIVVVTHHDYLMHLFNHVLTEDPSGNKELTVNTNIDCNNLPMVKKKGFHNCELRSFVLDTTPKNVV